MIKYADNIYNEILAVANRQRVVKKRVVMRPFIGRLKQDRDALIELRNAVISLYGQAPSEQHEQGAAHD